MSRAPVACRATISLAPPPSLIRGKEREALSLKEGDKIHGFTVTKVEQIDEYHITAVSLVHDVTGARYLHADSEDQNNCFNVTFRTTPTDSTGVAHVLEHTALCGSEKYPIRDPFFNMLKRSLNTFMNAMTAPDFTMYPFSTRNAQDYYNLLSVYLDASFFPKLTASDFKQEGHRLEFEDPEDKSSKLTYKGVVFNEMKGAMSSMDSQFGRELSSQLYPTSTYHHNSGGDPKNILELTHSQLVEFHATHYHPSNAFIFSYGDLPLGDTLERVSTWALDRFEAIDVRHLDVKDEQRLTEPRKVSVTGSPDAVVADPSKQTAVSVAWLLNNVPSDPFEVFRLRVASDLLVSGPSAPLYQALVEEFGAPYAAGTGYGAQRREASFAVGLKGIASEDSDKVEAAILATMERLAQEGFEDDRVDAVVHQIELSSRRVSTNFGLGMAFSIMPYWLHGGDPVSPVRVGAQVERLRAEMAADPKMWQSLIQKHFVSNPHRVTVAMTPSKEYNKGLEAAEAATLEKLEGALDDERRKQIVEEALALKLAQEAPQAVESLPTLSVSDVPPEVERTVSRFTEVAGTKVQWNDQRTNGITHVNLLYDLSELPWHLVPYLPLFSSLLSELGAGDRDYRQLAQAIKGSTGGIGVGLSGATSVNDLDRFEPTLLISANCLDRNLENMLALIADLTTLGPKGVRWDKEPKHLRTLLNRRNAALGASVASQGLSYARVHAGSTLTPEGALDNLTGGLPHVNLVQGLVGAGADPAALAAVPIALEAIATHLFSPDSSKLMRCRVAGEGERFPEVEALLGAWLAPQTPSLDQGNVGKFSKAVAEATGPKAGGAGNNTFFAVPSQTNYVARSVRTVPYTHVDAAPLFILGQVLSTCFLHREIREKGGAYGGGAAASPLSGTFTMNSYRDPRTLETVDTFMAAAEWATKDGVMSQQDLEEAKLRAFKSMDSPVAPSGRGSTLFLNGLDDDIRQTFRTQVLAVEIADVARVAQHYLVANAAACHTAIVGNEEKVKVKHGAGGWEVLGADLKPK